MNANAKSSPWEGKALMHHLRLYQLESSSAEEDLEVLVYSKLNTSQPYAAKAKAQPDKYTDLALFTCDQPFYTIFFLPTTNPPLLVPPWALFRCTLPLQLPQSHYALPTSWNLRFASLPVTKSDLPGFLDSPSNTVIIEVCLLSFSPHICLSHLCLYVLFIDFTFSLVHHFTRSSIR